MSQLRTSSYQIRTALYQLAKTVTPNVFGQDRPLASQEQMDKFIVVSIKSKYPHSCITDTGYIQFNLYVRDKANGQFNDDVMQGLIDAVKELDMRSELWQIQGTPLETDPKTDKLGFHAVIIQWRAAFIGQTVNN